jgi:glycosyltransferase involved in cell wall biosynthesis
LPPAQDVERVFRGFDISVTPSRGEPFGLVVIEAMASGTPVVATDAGGIPEIVTNGVDGLLVPPRDPEALAGAIIQLLTNRELAERLKNAAIETTRTRFPEPLMARQFDRIYTSLLGV